jgi:hypothetical protein
MPLMPVSVLSRPALSDEDQLMEELGWKGWYMNPAQCGETTPTSGDLKCNAMAFKAGDIVSTIGACVTTAAVSPTLFRMALYSSTFALLASTANDTALVASDAMIEKAVSVPYQFTSDQLAYVGILSLHSSLGMLGTTGTAEGQFGRTGFLRPTIYQTGLSDLPNPIVPVTPGTKAAFHWIAWA